MKFGLTYHIKAGLEGTRSLANINLEKNNPLTGYAALAGIIASGIDFHITQFQKYGCVDAVNRPGYNCDYLVKINMSGKYLGAYGDIFNKINRAEMVTARFSKVNGKWRIVDFLK